MRLGAIAMEDGERACVIDGDEVVVLSQAGLSGSVAEILGTGLTGVREAVASGLGRAPLSSVHLTAPVRPSKFFGVGLNYADHAAEVGREPTEFPTVFAKMVSCVQRAV